MMLILRQPYNFLGYSSALVLLLIDESGRFFIYAGKWLKVSFCSILCVDCLSVDI